jgi:hypothetical protein
VRARREAPVEDHSAIPVGQLRRRLRPPGAERMRQLIAFEGCHGGRPEVLEIPHDCLYRSEHGDEPPKGPVRNHDTNLRREVG